MKRSRIVMFLVGLAAIFLVNLATIDYDSGPKVVYDRNGIFDIFSTTAAVADTGGGGGGGPIQDREMTITTCYNWNGGFCGYGFYCHWMGNDCYWFDPYCFC